MNSMGRAGKKRKGRGDKSLKLFRKRARDYNSDDDGDAAEAEQRCSVEAQAGVTRLVQGCRAFRVAFAKILRLKVSGDAVGAVLAGHKGSVAERLDLRDRRKGGTEKRTASEKGHVKPPRNNLMDAHSRFLLTVATKGAVKFFNAVSKAQKGVADNPSRARDSKRAVTRMRRHSKPSATANHAGEQPGWAPLRDNYMVTQSRKFDKWDDVQDSMAAVEAPLDSSSGDDDA